MKNSNYKSKDIIMQEICQVITEANNSTNDEAKEEIIVIGNTGVGKSTLINYLAKTELTAISEDEIDFQIKALEPNGKLPSIGDQSSVSCTTNPVKWFNEENNVIYWDCPGFSDTRSGEQQIKNAIYINKLFRPDTAKKILLVVSEGELLNPKLSFNKLIKSLSELFVVENTQEQYSLHESISLVVTKVEKIKTVDIARNKIIAICNEQLKQGLNNSEQFIIETLKSLNKSNISFFHNPVETGKISSDDFDKISASLNNIAAAKDIKVKISLESEAKNLIIELIKTIKANKHDEIDKIINGVNKNLNGVTMFNKPADTQDQKILNIKQLKEKIDKFNVDLSVPNFISLVKNASALCTKNLVNKNNLDSLNIYNSYLETLYKILSEVEDDKKESDISGRQYLEIQKLFNTCVTILVKSQAKQINLKIDETLKKLTDNLRADIEVKLSSANYNYVSSVSKKLKELSILKLLDKGLIRENSLEKVIKDAEEISNSLEIPANDYLKEIRAQYFYLEELDRLSPEIIKLEQSCFNIILEGRNRIDNINRLKAIKDLACYLKNCQQWYQEEGDIIMESSSHKLAIGNPIIKLSAIKNILDKEIQSSTKEKSIQIFGLDTIYLDVNLTDDQFKGKNISIIAPKIEVADKLVRIDLSGKKFEVAKDWQPKAAKGQDFIGGNGKDGEHGLPGNSAGNLLMVTKNLINLKNLTVFTEGGNGGPGQDAGHGGEGRKGENANISDLQPEHSFWSGTESLENFEKRLKLDKIVEYDRYNLIGKDFKFIYQLKGKEGGKGGDSGRVGGGGKGGKGGRFLAIEHNEKESITLVNMIGKIGESGEPGNLGTGGIGGRYGDAARVITYSGVRLSMMNKGAPEMITKWGTPYLVESEDRGPNGKVITEENSAHILDSIEVPVESPYHDIADYMLFFMTKLNKIKDSDFDFSNFKNLQLLSISDLKPKSPQDLIYKLKILEKINLTVGINEASIENQVKLYKTFQNEVKNFYTDNQEAISGLGSNNVLNLLHNLYTKSHESVCQLHESKETSIITDLKKYFDFIITRINKLEELETSLAKNIYRENYNNTIKDKIGKANYAIDRLKKNIENSQQKISEAVSSAVQEIEKIKKDINNNSADLMKMKLELENLAIIQKMLGVLNVGCKLLAFAGPVGAIIGEVAGAGVNIAANAINNDKVIVLSPDINNLSIKVEDFLAKDINHKIRDIDQKALNDEKLCVELDELFNQFKGGDEAQTSKNMKKYSSAEKEQMVLLAKTPEGRKELLAKLNKDIELFNQNGMPSSLREYSSKLQKNQKILEARVENDKRIAILNNLKVAGEACDAGLQLYRATNANKKQVAEFDEKLKNNAENIRKLNEKTIKIINVHDNIVDGMSSYINNVSNKLKERTAPVLDLQKYEIKKKLEGIKSILEGVTSGLKSNEILGSIIEEVQESMSVVIDIYGRLEHYSEQMELAIYIEFMTSNNKHKDTEYSEALKEIDQIHLTNAMVKGYSKALNAFEQLTFPYGKYYVKETSTSEELQSIAKFIDDGSNKHLLKQIKDDIGKLNEKVIEDQLQVNPKFDNIVYNSTFSNIVGSKPFFTWSYANYPSQVEDLLKGKEVILNSNIYSSDNSVGTYYSSSPKHYAVKFQKIGLKISIKDQEEQTKIVDNVLSKYNIMLEHSGESNYKWRNASHDDEIISINSNGINSQKIRLVENYNGSSYQTRLLENNASIKLKGKEPSKAILSPYTVWHARIEGIEPDPKAGKVLEELKQAIVPESLTEFIKGLEVHLVGEGQYVDLSEASSELKYDLGI